MKRIVKRGLLVVTVIVSIFVVAVLVFSFVVLNDIRKSFTEDGSAPPIVEPPCGNEAQTIALSGARRGQEVAYFSTDGSDIYITAKEFEDHFLLSNTRTTAIYIGEHDKLPEYDEQSSAVSNTIANLHVKENEYTKGQLPGGRYWLWTSNFPKIVEIASCGEISS